MKHPKHLWFAVDKDGSEYVYDDKPMIIHSEKYGGNCNAIRLPIGTIQHITGKTLTWEDKPLKWKPPNDECRCIKFVGGDTWYPNGCKIHPEGR